MREKLNIVLLSFLYVYIAASKSVILSSRPAVFHFFPKLPTELWLMIWHQCLLHHVHKLDILFNMVVFHSPHYYLCDLSDSAWANRYPPLITQVCRES